MLISIFILLSPFLTCAIKNHYLRDMIIQEFAISFEASLTRMKTRVSELERKPKDYEIFFEANISKSHRKKKESEIVELGGAFDLVSTTYEDQPEFDPSPYIEKYESWFQQLIYFSLLFYGAGSKHDLLHHFASSLLEKYGIVIEIDGYSNQQRQMQECVRSLCQIMSIQSENAQSVINRLNSKREHAFIIIHSFDAETILDNDSIRIVAQLNGCKYIHFVVSFDRIPYFPIEFFSKMNFLTININTYQPYTAEMQFAKESTKGNDVMDSTGRYIAILSTLTANAKGIFKVLIKHQLKTNEGLNIHEWAEKATEELCVNVTNSINNNIIEFKDHDLLTEKKGDAYAVPLSHGQLQALCTQLEGE